MTTNEATLETRLPAAADELPAMIDNVITGFALPQQLPGILHINIKWILTELSTNAYKHAPVDNTAISIHISENRITITKTDNGEPPYFHALPAGQKLSIYTYNGGQLFAEKDAEGFIYFYEEPQPGILDIELLCEHFGLLIITRSSSRFTYSRCENLTLNTFTAVIDY